MRPSVGLGLCSKPAGGRRIDELAARFVAPRALAASADIPSRKHPAAGVSVSARVIPILTGSPRE